MSDGAARADVGPLLAAMLAEQYEVPRRRVAKARLLASEDPTVPPAVAAALEGWSRAGHTVVVCDALEILAAKRDPSAAKPVAALARELLLLGAKDLVLRAAVVTLVRLRAEPALVGEALALPWRSVDRERLFGEVADALLAEDPALAFDLLSAFAENPTDRRGARLLHGMSSTPTLDRRWWPLVAPLLDHPNEVTSRYGVAAVAVVDAPEKVPAILERAGDRWLEAPLLTALARHRGEPAKAVLLRHLDAPDVPALAAAAWGVRSFGETESALALQALHRRLLRSLRSAWRVDVVARALEGFDDPSSAPVAREARAMAKKLPAGGMVGRKKDILARIDGLVARLERKSDGPA